jgi:cell division protein ZapA
MAGKGVELNVAGQRCRVVSTATEKELRVLASMVEDKLAALIVPGRPVTTQAMLLAAVALAHDAQEQRARAETIADKARRALSGLLERVDSALAESEAERAKRKPGAYKARDHDGGR